MGVIQTQGWSGFKMPENGEVEPDHGVQVKLIESGLPVAVEVVPPTVELR